MPNYGRYTDPTEQYQGTAFDPLSGRLNVGQLIQQFILRKRAEEEQAKQAQWEMQDRAWAEEQRGLQKRGAELGIEAQERAARDYQPPVPRALQNFLDYAGAKAQEQTRLREIEAMKNADIEKARAKPTKTTKELDSDYLSDVEAATKRYADYRLAARKELQAYNKSLIDNKFTYQDPAEFSSAQQSAVEQYNDYLKQIDEYEQIEMASIDERYSDLPRAQLSKKRRGQKPAGQPKQELPGGVEISGQKSRKSLPKDAKIKVLPDGRKVTKIGDKIYEIID